MTTNTDRSGPTLVTPEPYLSCRGCKHYRSAVYWEHGEQPYCMSEGRDLTNHSICNDLLTPPWCPLLPKSEGDTP